MVRQSVGTFEEVFWSKVDVRGPDECWPWKLTPSEYGYGVFSSPVGKLVPPGISPARLYRAHRVAYALMLGAIPEGLDIDHVCHTRECLLGVQCPHRMCCNPHHLVVSSHVGNVMRGGGPLALNALKTHCLRGHLLEGSNLMRRDRPGRECRICANARQMERYWSRKSMT